MTAPDETNLDKIPQVGDLIKITRGDRWIKGIVKSGGFWGGRIGYDIHYEITSPPHLAGKIGRWKECVDGGEIEVLQKAARL